MTVSKFQGEIPEQFVEDINEYEIADEAEGLKHYNTKYNVVFLGRRYHLKKGEFRCNLCKMRNFATQVCKLLRYMFSTIYCRKSWTCMCPSTHL